MSSPRLGALLLSLAMAGSLTGESFAQTPGSTAPSPESQVQRILTKQQIAWNIGDSASWGASFAEDADFINMLGQSFHGREAIRQLHATIFSGPYKGSHTKVTMRQFKQITPDVLLVEALHELTNFKSLPPGITPTEGGTLKTRMRYVLLKRDELWQIIAAQDTAILPLAAGEVH